MPRLILILLLLHLPALAQTALDTFHQAVETFQWERAQSLADSLPAGGPRELAKAEIAVFTSRLYLTFPLTENLTVEQLPPEYHAKLFLIRAYQAEDTNAAATDSARNQAMVRTAREGLRQSGTAHDRARLLQLQLARTPSGQPQAYREILNELLKTPGVSEALVLETQASAAGKDGRYPEAASLRRALASSAQLQGHTRAYLTYGLMAARSLPQDQRSKALDTLWQTALAAKDPWLLGEIANGYPQFDQKPYADKILAVLDSMPDDQGKLRLLDQLSMLYDDFALIRQLAARGEKLAQKLDDPMAAALFRLQTHNGLESHPQVLAQLRAQIDPAARRGLRRSWLVSLELSLARDAALGTELSEATLDAALSAQTSPLKRIDAYNRHLAFAVLHGNAALAHRAYFEGLAEALRLPEADRYFTAANFRNDLQEILSRASSPAHRRVVGEAILDSLRTRLVQKPDLIEGLFDTNLAYLRDANGQGGARSALARWLSLLGRASEAREMLEAEVDSRAPASPQSLAEYQGFLWLQGDPQAWAARRDALLAADKTQGEEVRGYSQARMSWEALRAEQWGEAETFARFALSHPDEKGRVDASAHLALAQALIAQKRYDEAFAAISHGDLTKTPSLALARVEALARSGQRQEAAQALAGIELPELSKLDPYELRVRRLVGPQPELDRRIQIFLAQPSSMPDDPLVQDHLKAALLGTPRPTLTPTWKAETFATFLKNVERLRRREPDNAELRRLSAADLKALMENAAPDEVFVQPVLMRQSVALLSLDKDGANVTEVFCDPQRLRLAVDKLNSALSSPESTLPGDNLTYLSERLIQPWRIGYPQARRLRWMGEGTLQRLPLSALPDSHGKPLLETLEILYLDGAGREETTFEARTPTLIVGGETDLPGAAQELRAVRKLFPSGQHWDLGTPLEQLKTLLPQHRILHVATHGLPPGAQRLGAQLGGARGLSAFELSELAFPTGSLAVLGACESALDAQTGTDNSSLVSAARTAGADQVVGSLWPIDDQVTSELFATFYQGLAQGHTPARALREAQRAVAKSHPHPYYWAALQVVSGPRR